MPIVNGAIGDVGAPTSEADQVLMRAPRAARCRPTSGIFVELSLLVQHVVRRGPNTIDGVALRRDRRAPNGEGCCCFSATQLSAQHRRIALHRHERHHATVVQTHLDHRCRHPLRFFHKEEQCADEKQQQPDDAKHDCPCRS